MNLVSWCELKCAALTNVCHVLSFIVALMTTGLAPPAREYMWNSVPRISGSRGRVVRPADVWKQPRPWKHFWVLSSTELVGMGVSRSRTSAARYGEKAIVLG